MFIILVSKTLLPIRISGVILKSKSGKANTHDLSGPHKNFLKAENLFLRYSFLAVKKLKGSIGLCFLHHLSPFNNQQFK